MKVPGAASLHWEVSPEGNRSRLVQTAMFVPRGLAGVLYWYLLYPLHGVIFSDLARDRTRRRIASEVRSDVEIPVTFGDDDCRGSTSRHEKQPAAVKR